MPESKPWRDGLLEVRGDIVGMYERLELDDGQPIELGHLADVGRDFYIFAGRGWSGYVIAGGGHAGGDRLSRDRERLVTYWVTPADWPQLRAWKSAVAFITGEVEESLTQEWSDMPEPGGSAQG